MELNIKKLFAHDSTNWYSVFKQDIEKKGLGIIWRNHMSGLKMKWEYEIIPLLRAYHKDGLLKQDITPEIAVGTWRAASPQNNDTDFTEEEQKEIEGDDCNEATFEGSLISQSSEIKWFRNFYKISVKLPTDNK